MSPNAFDDAARQLISPVGIVMSVILERPFLPRKAVYRIVSKRFGRPLWPQRGIELQAHRVEIQDRRLFLRPNLLYRFGIFGQRRGLSAIFVKAPR